MSLTKKESDALYNDPALQVAFREIEDGGVRPMLVCFRDGKEIGGNWCRFTIGTMALLDVADNAIFSDKGDDVDPTVRDCIEAIFICSDRYRDSVVWIANDPERFRKSVDRFANGFGKRGLIGAANDFREWLSEMYATMQSPVDSAQPKQGQWWADMVDVFAHEYHWEESYIFWDLPIVRAYQYQESIVARRGGGGRVNEIPDSMCRALDRSEVVLRNLRDNGKS